MLLSLLIDITIIINRYLTAREKRKSIKTVRQSAGTNKKRRICAQNRRSVRRSPNKDRRARRRQFTLEPSTSCFSFTMAFLAASSVVKLRKTYGFRLPLEVSKGRSTLSTWNDESIDESRASANKQY